MLEGSKVVVVIPAFDVAARVGGVVASLPDFVDHAVVVDDGSRDDTSGAARDAAVARRRRALCVVDVLRHATNGGVGAAIATGMRRALALTTADRDALVVMAGDGQMDPGDLAPLVSAVARGEAGYAKGDRFSHPGIAAMPLERRFAGRVLSVLTGFAIGVPIRDSQSGYTAISRAVARRILWDRVWPRYGYPNDLLGILARDRVPITHAIVRPVYEGAPSGLTAAHVPKILRIVAACARRRVVRRLSAKDDQIVP